MLTRGEKLPVNTIEGTALHESAHVICALVVGLAVDYVTIKPEEGRLEGVQQEIWPKAPRRHSPGVA
jgi:hypothetical protein